MRKIVLGILGVVAICGIFTGCASHQTSLQNYSIQSYQGPLPMGDYRLVNPESYGVPVSPR